MPVSYPCVILVVLLLLSPLHWQSLAPAFPLIYSAS
jgi:hypothetical protein